MRESTKHDVEDFANAPDRNLYIGIGFNKNDNKFHVLEKNKEQLMLTLGEQIKNKDDEDTMELIPKENKVEIKLKVISAVLDALKGTSKVLSQKDILFCNSSIFNLNILS